MAKEKKSTLPLEDFKKITSRHPAFKDHPKMKVFPSKSGDKNYPVSGGYGQPGYLMVLIQNCRTKQIKLLQETMAINTPADDGQQHTSAKKKCAAPVPITKYSTRPGESEAERRVRVRCEGGTRRERDQRQRAEDRQRQRALLRHPNRLQPGWRQPPPPREGKESAVERAQRVDGYFTRLDELSRSFHTCPNCLQRDCNHFHLGPDDRCARCAMPSQALSHDGEKLRESNGLQLRVDGEEPWQQAWAQLKRDHGELSPLEEALVSPVLVMTSVLQLPSGQQLGYRGSVINFVNETASVAEQLPRTPSDANIIVYRVRGNAGTYKDTRVRKGAVWDHLDFFSRHHQLFKDGITDPLTGAIIVPPFKTENMSMWLNESALENLPDDGVLDDTDGLDVRYIEEEEAADERPARDDCPHDDGADSDCDNHDGADQDGDNEDDQDADPVPRVLVRTVTNSTSSCKTECPHV